MPLADELRIRTTLVCGALAIAIAFSAVLRGKVRNVHWLFAAFAGDVGLWYLSQSLFGVFQAAFWEQLRAVLAVLAPMFAVNLFEAMVPDEGQRKPRLGRYAMLLAIPMLLLALSPYVKLTVSRVTIFLYAVGTVAAGLYQLGQRGRRSRSRATQRRVRFLVVVGALAGLFSVVEFTWVLGGSYRPPPVGVVLSVVFLFILAQALRHERLLDLYEMVGRLLVAMAVAILIATLFYILVTVVGQPHTMYLNAVLVAVVVLVLFDPLRDRVEQQIQRIVFRERRKLEAALSLARRRLTHTLEVEDMGRVVMAALERSRSVTDAALYLRLEDGTGFERRAAIGDKAPPHIEVATANALLDRLAQGTVMLERLQREAKERGGTGQQVTDTLLAAAEVLGPLRSGVLIGIHAEEHDLVGLLVVADDRIRDAFSPEDVALLEAFSGHIGVVVENSRVYAKMKERDRLTVLGQMAAGLAHEIRNPLGAIKGAAQLLMDPRPSSPALDESSSEFLGIILEEVDRLDGVVGSVLDLAKQKPDVVGPLDVNAEVRRTLQVLGTELDSPDIALRTELADELPRAAIGADPLRQIIMNLTRNAVQATSGSGAITLTTRSHCRTGGTFVHLSVHDTGPGMSAATVKKIFLPFFTTKERGTGLGLAICQRIAQTAGGRIEVRSREGEGSTFTVVLPAAVESLGSTPTTPVIADSQKPDEGQGDSDGGSVASASGAVSLDAADVVGER